MIKLVERSQESSALDTALGECSTGHGTIFWISGPMGMGKTELVHNFTQRAATDGVQVFGATASRAESAVPLGLISQLFAGAQLPAETADRVAKLLDDGIPGGGPGGPWADEVRPWVLRELHSALSELTAGRRTVITIDDIQYAEASSLQFLLYLARRLRSTPLLLIITEQTSVHPPDPFFHAELLRQPNCRHIRLAPLSDTGVTNLVHEHTDAATAEELGHEIYRISGGNPLLVRGLLEDLISGPAQDGDGHVVGDGFARAVMSCLYRCEPLILDVARALSVLNGPKPITLVGGVAGHPVRCAKDAVAMLAESGLVSSGWFRHAKAQAAVAGAMTAYGLVLLHSRAALLLHESGAPAAEVARHLIAARDRAEPWMTTVLVDAAEQALAEDDGPFALDCLRFAEQTNVDGRHTEAIQWLMLRAEWRADPSAAGRRAASYLTSAAEHGTRSQILAVKSLFWCGQPSDAVTLLERLWKSAESFDAQTAAELRDTQLWMSFFYPGLDRPGLDRPGLNRHRPPEPFGATSPVGTTLLNRSFTQFDVSEALTAAVYDDGCADAVALAEQLLQRSRLSETTVLPIMLSLAMLVNPDEQPRARYWCGLFGEEAVGRGQMWNGLLSAARALVALRQGDLTATLEHSRVALRTITPKRWGVAVGLPLATSVLAMTAMAQFSEAANQLNVPVPEAMYQTPFGLMYLQARGRCYLTARHYHAALEDLQACGDLMAAWDLDLPAFVAWRSDAAQACLGLGLQARAHELLTDQLAMLTPRMVRTRGVTLRILAAIEEPGKRRALLETAVENLRSSGNRLELAHALADLSEVCLTQGEQSQARRILHWALQLATECGDELLRRRLTAGTSGATQAFPTIDCPLAPDRVVELSEAERRVAALAARGLTNRQIARKLYISVSTVEQHLTKAYRKLQVKTRADLPRLELDSLL